MATIEQTSRLRLTRRGPRREYVLALSGELDMLAAPSLEQAVQGLCSDGARAIVIDMRELTFVDSRGLQATLTIQRCCREYCCELCLIPAPSRVQSLFEMTGLAEALPFQHAEDHVHLPPDAILPTLFAPTEDAGEEDA